MHTRTLRDTVGRRFVHAVWRIDLRRGALPPFASVALRQGLQALAGLDQATLSKRVVVAAGAPPRITWQCRAPLAPSEPAADLLAALWQKLVHADAVEWPADDADFEALLGDAPGWRSLLVPARYRSGERWLAGPSRAVDLWPRIGCLAGPFDGRAAPGDARPASTPTTDAARAARDTAVGYQINLYPYRAPPAQQRDWLLNLDALQARPGVPAWLKDLQAGIVQRARGGRWLAEELLLASTPAWAGALQRQVDASFAAARDALGGGPSLSFEFDGCRDPLELACGVDEVWAAEPAYAAAQAMDRDAALAALRPDDDLALLPAAPAMTAAGDDGDASALADAPYVFLSYAHADRAAMQRARASLHAAGVATWVDERLQAGEEWAAVLESRIRRCAALLVLMSPAAAASRFVRRELRFADAMERRIACLRLQPTELRDGLAMLLLPLQWVDACDDGAHERLALTLRSWLSTAPGSRRAA